MKKNTVVGLLMLVMLFSNSLVMAAIDGQTRLKPFTLADEIKGGNIAQVTETVRQKLNRSGFDIIGSYTPYDSANIFIVTTSTLKQVASQSRYGGFGAALRVGVTQVGDSIQVTHNNPNYIGLAYNMKDDLSSIKRQFRQTLGFMKDYGGGEGIKASDLPSYNYTFGLEGFTGFFEFIQYKSYQDALRKVEASLDAGKNGISKVYRLDVPGKQQTVIGLSLKGDEKEQPFLNDKFVMGVIDNKQLRRSAHLPYEIMIDGNKVIAMHPHYRLAVNFPDLKMFGKHSFGRLMDLPYVYEEFFTRAVGGQWPPADYWN
jgi:hypothetical protein